MPSSRNAFRRLLAGLAGTCLIVLCVIADVPGRAEARPSRSRDQRYPSSGLISHSECKRFIRSLSPHEAPPNQDCVAYHFGSDGTLTLKHINAAFSCRTADIHAHVSMRNDTITIVENESWVRAFNCLCLYDLDYRLQDVQPGRYTFRFLEPHATSPLVFTINLVPHAADTYSVARSNYPWGTRGATAQPFGLFMGSSGCKIAPHIPNGLLVPADVDCIEYFALTNNDLAVEHVNAACCPNEITAGIEVTNDTIRIVERAGPSIQDCPCPCDLRYRVNNLQHRPYVIEVVEQYVQTAAERLVIPIDLAAVPEGFVGRYRDHYPWSYSSTMRTDSVVLDRMRTEIINFIGTPSCGGEDCRYIALGVKPCGGPWEYLIYSAPTIDVDSLRFMVSRYNTFDDGFNRRYNVASDCRFVVPPRIGCIEGRCSDLDHPRK